MPHQGEVWRNKRYPDRYVIIVCSGDEHDVRTYRAEGKVSSESRKSFIDSAHLRDRFDKY
jgi:hypothetical protein